MVYVQARIRDEVISMYKFTDDCLLGIPEIDREHEHLFQLINDGYMLLNSDQELKTAAQKLLGQLREYANTHFDHEEAYMKHIDDPELFSQKREHEDFSSYMDQINFSELTEEQMKPALENLLNYLSRWLFHHILSSDTLIGKYESPFAFTSKYITGIDEVDQEHRNLFQMVKDINDLMLDDYIFDKYDKIVSILEQLRDYAREHFLHEEAYMEKIGYPGIEQQKQAHEAFCDKVAEIRLDDIDENQQEYLEDLIKFLLNWLSVHILHMDKAIGDYDMHRQAD